MGLLYTYIIIFCVCNCPLMVGSMIERLEFFLNTYIHDL